MSDRKSKTGDPGPVVQDQGSGYRPTKRAPIQDCPVARHRDRITGLSKDMVRELRALRRELAACGSCPQYPDCPILSELNTQVQTAIHEVVDEWNLAETAALSRSE